METNNGTNLPELSEQDKDQRKYLALKRKCEEVQQTNEKLVNRIYHVKKMIKRYRKERRLVQMRLDLHGDGYKEAEVPVMWQEGQLYGAPVPPDTPPPDSKPGSLSPLPDTLQHLASTSSSGSMKTAATSSKVAAGSSGASKSGSASATSKSGPGKTGAGGSAAGGGAAGTTGGATKGKKAKGSGEKKPPNAYIVFCQMQRSVIQKRFLQENKEECSQTELTKLLSQEWNGLEPEKKKVYYEISDQRKQEAERKQALTVQSHLKQAQASGNASFVSSFLDLVKNEGNKT